MRVIGETVYEKGWRRRVYKRNEEVGV